MTFPAIEHVAFLFLMAIIFIVSIYGLGNFTSRLFRLESRIERSIVFGLFVLIIPSWYFSRLDQSPLVYMRIALLFGIAWSAVILVKAIFNKNFQPLTDFGIILIACGVSALSLWRPIREMANRGIHDGIFTLGNADVANYALDVKAILDKGFAPSNIIENLSYGLHALGDYSGAMIFLSVPNSFFGDSSADLLIAGIVTLNAVLWLSLEKVSRIILGTKQFGFITASVATAGVLIPMHQYIVGNFFAAQILSMGLTFLAVGLILERLLNGADRGVVAELSVLSALNVFVYPPIGIPMFLAIWIFVLGQDVTSQIQNLKSSLVFLGVTTFVVGMQWTWAVNLFSAQTTVAAGWPLPNISLGSAILWVDQLGVPGSPILTQGSWILLVFLFLFSVFSSKGRVNPKVRLMVSAIGVATCLVLALVTFQYGYGYYQMWKALAYLLPLFVVLTISLLFTSKWLGPAKHLVIGVLIGAGVASTSTLWGPTINAANQGSEAISNPDMTLLSNNLKLQELTSINVQLRPYLETMLASAIIPVDNVSMASQTYAEALVLTDTCTLKRRDELVASDPVEFEINSTYVVVSIPSLCKR